MIGKFDQDNYGIGIDNLNDICEVDACCNKYTEIHINGDYTSLEIDYKNKIITAFGEGWGRIKMNYCPICGRKL